MNDSSTPHSRLDIDHVATRCAEESRIFFQGGTSDDSFCYELFRRAIVNRNSHAWELIFQQYRNLVSGWLRRNSAFSPVDSDVEELITITFTRFWHSLNPTKFTRFESLQALLRYLQMCAGSAVTDRLRRRRHDQLLDPIERRQNEIFGETPEQTVLADVERARFWAEIRGMLNDEQEELLIYSYFVLGLKPRQIHARFSTQFPDIEDVYRVKRNVLNRLRRAPGLEAWWQVSLG